MRLGVYGGSFDPPHLAHVQVAARVVSDGLVDQVLVVPVHGRAFAKDLLPFTERLELCQLAFAGLDGVTVSDIERDLPTPNFTVETLLAVRTLHPAADLRLIVGADVLADLPRWHRIDEVLTLAPLLAVGRIGFNGIDVHDLALPDVASSRLRQDLRQRRDPDSPARQQLPRAVWDHIVDRGLYL